MAVIKIENFGGELPSISPRALPPDAAQENRNLYLAAREFRPLSADSSVASCPSGTKTLHRFSRKVDGSYNSDTSTGWIASTQERSYVKGQINDERTERTYYTTDDGSVRPRVVDVNGADRILGVPRPTKPSVSLYAPPSITVEEATTYANTEITRAIRNAIAASKWPDGVTGHYSGSTIFAGAYSTHGLALHSESWVPSRFTNEWWGLYARIANSDISRLGIRVDVATGAPTSEGQYWVIQVFALPYRFYFVESILRANLAAITGPDGVTPVLTQDNIDLIVDSASGILDPNMYAPAQRMELDRLVGEFADIVTSIPGLPTNSGVDYGDRITMRLGEIADRAAFLVREIEQLGAAKWAYVTDPSTDVVGLVEALGGPQALLPYAFDQTPDTRFYIVTVVTDWGEESEPSPVSDMVVANTPDTVTITRPPLSTGESFAARNITKWRIYRSNAGSLSASFQFVDEVPIGTADYTDSKAPAQLGESCPSIAWSEPPYRMNATADGFPKPTSGTNPYLRGLVGMPNGILAGFFDNTVAFCEPYVPYAWPVEYQIVTEFPIVGLGVFGQTLFVGTTANPYFIYGADSASMTAQRLDSNQACSSRRSIATVQGGVLYASPDGLCVADQNGITVVSAGIFTREDWQKLQPSSMFAIEHESIYYLFYSGNGGGCLTFDLAAKKLGRIDLTGSAAFVDRISDTLFVASGTSIKAVFGDTARRTGRWKSALITFPQQTAFAWLKVYGSQTALSPVTVRWYGDGALRHTTTIADTSPVRLPPGKWLEHEIEVESSARITKVEIASSTEELQSV